MKRVLVFAGFLMTVPLLTAPADAQRVCRDATTCQSAYNSCSAKRAAKWVTTDCEAALKTCNATGLWHGKTRNGVYVCRMPYAGTTRG
jgi:hypothetical protein